jgi:quercetin dioxygenase-like cupin family protein
MIPYRSIILCIVLVVCLLALQQGKAQDPAKVAGKNYKVLFESDKVRVLDVLYKPGEKAAMHSHPYHVAYGLTDSKFKFTLPSGKTMDINGKAGEVLEGPPGLHSPENVGTSDAHLIVFEVKEPVKKMKK